MALCVPEGGRPGLPGVRWFCKDLVVFFEDPRPGILAFGLSWWQWRAPLGSWAPPLGHSWPTGSTGLPVTHGTTRCH